jgi:hypothetical protein
MLSGLKTHFGANAGLTAQIGAHLHRLIAPANAGEGTGKKYVTYRPLTDSRPLKVSGTRSTARDRVEFVCHGRLLEDATAVYDALIAVVPGQFRGTWGGVEIQSAFWDGDTYEEEYDARNREVTISITLSVTWTRT